MGEVIHIPDAPCISIFAPAIPFLYPVVISISRQLTRGDPSTRQNQSNQARWLFCGSNTGGLLLMITIGGLLVVNNYHGGLLSWKWLNNWWLKYSRQIPFHEILLPMIVTRHQSVFSTEQFSFVESSQWIPWRLIFEGPG